MEDTEHAREDAHLKTKLCAFNKVTRGYSPRPCGHQDVRIRLSLITHWLGLQPFISIQGELGEQIHFHLSLKVACIM